MLHSFIKVLYLKDPVLNIVWLYNVHLRRMMLTQCHFWFIPEYDQWI